MILKTVGDKKLLYVMAAELEYGAHLKKCFTPLMTGVGPVEAAISLSNALHKLDTKPDCIISLGSAGSAKLEQAEVYQVSSIAYRDMDASPLGFEKGATPLLDIPAILEMGHQNTGLKKASLSTGASIVSGKAYNAIDADMVDMETFAIQRVCMTHGISLIGLRGISDGKEELSQFSDWTQYLNIIDEKLAGEVVKIEQAIVKQEILVSTA